MDHSNNSQSTDDDDIQRRQHCTTTTTNDDSSIIQVLNDPCAGHHPSSSSSPSSSATSSSLLASSSASSLYNFYRTTRISPKDYFKRKWKAYQKWVQSNHDTLIVIDEVTNRLLFWSPHSSNWREMAWGVLELNRLCMDLAMEEEQYDTETNPLGTSMTVIVPSSYPKQQKQIQQIAIALRIGLTIVQSLGPVAQELVLLNHNKSDNNRRKGQESVSTQQQRVLAQSKVRRSMERIRFVSRMTLLLTYWRQFYQVQRKQQQQQHSSSSSSSRGTKRPHQQVLPGLLLNGGLFQQQSSSLFPAPTYYQEKSRMDRETYVGKRTGRRLNGRNNNNYYYYDTTAASATNHNINKKSSNEHENSRTGIKPSAFQNKIKIAIGELLYLIRPLLQAEQEVLHCNITDNQKLKDKKQWLLWLICLGMDLSSLTALNSAYQEKHVFQQRRNNNNNNNNDDATATTTNTKCYNPVTVQELRRRQMRLLLYVLRCPVWERCTEPVLAKTTAVMDYIPLLGPLLTNYIWDWIYYWKHYRAEEG